LLGLVLLDKYFPERIEGGHAVFESRHADAELQFVAIERLGLRVASAGVSEPCQVVDRERQRRRLEPGEQTLDVERTLQQRLGVAVLAGEEERRAEALQDRRELALPERALGFRDEALARRARLPRAARREQSLDALDVLLQRAD